MANGRRRRPPENSGGAMTVNLHFPLSGAVAQAFDIPPFTLGMQPWSIPIGTVNLGSSRDAELERRILDEAGSYGRQIGRISDALCVLIEKIEMSRLAELTQEERDAIDDFRFLVRQIRKVKREAADEERR
jgi:hypothetical protein